MLLPKTLPFTETSGSLETRRGGGRRACVWWWGREGGGRGGGGRGGGGDGGERDLNTPLHRRNFHAHSCARTTRHELGTRNTISWFFDGILPTSDLLSSSATMNYGASPRRDTSDDAPREPPCAYQFQLHFDVTCPRSTSARSSPNTKPDQQPRIDQHDP